jgi:hypothetical protein
VTLLALALGSLLLERVLAVVDRRPVLLSEVRLVEEVRGLPEKAALDALIDERLMFQEATRLSPSAVSEEEETRAVQPLLARQLRASEADLRGLARRQLAILRYVELRFRPQVRVSDEEVQEAWRRAWEGRADAPPLAVAGDALREELLARRLDQRVEQWVRELRDRAEVRYVP